MQILNKIPLHPLLFSIYPICYLYSQNAMYVDTSQVIRPAALSLAMVLFFLLGFRLILGEWIRAGLLTSLIITLFFSFGHVATLIEPYLATQGIPLKEAYLGGAWLVLFLVVSFFVVQRRSSYSLTGLLNFTSALLLVVPLAAIIMITTGKASPSEREIRALAKLRGDDTALPETGAQIKNRTPGYEPSDIPGDKSYANLTEMPDIYFLVLDGYARADVLQNVYGYDNQTFIEALIGRGFYIVDHSRSNYLSTNYSLNSTLNLVYFQDLPGTINRNARYNLKTNYVSDFLRQLGYQVVIYDSGTGNTNNQYSDQFITPGRTTESPGTAIMPFEILLLRTTLGRLLLASDNGNGDQAAAGQTFRASVNQELTRSRERIRHAFAHLPDFATHEGNFYLFAHIYLPHVPFLYGPDGEALEYHGDPNVNWYLVHPDHYAEYYGFQIDYLNKAVLATIDRIQQTSTKPVVIIIQADHGDDFLLDWSNPSADGVAARSSILNAIYYSDRSYEDLYKSMTSVNTFRLVFKHWFGT